MAADFLASQARASDEDVQWDTIPPAVDAKLRFQSKWRAFEDAGCPTEQQREYGPIRSQRKVFKQRKSTGSLNLLDTDIEHNKGHLKGR